jgi:hypothetical protein
MNAVGTDDVHVFFDLVLHHDLLLLLAITGSEAHDRAGVGPRPAPTGDAQRLALYR